MEESLVFEPDRAAVLSMDLQTGIVGIYAKDDPLLPDRAAKVLESLDRRSGAGTEDPGFIRNYVDPQCGQARLQVRDRWTGVTGLQVQTRMVSE